MAVLGVLGCQAEPEDDAVLLASEASLDAAVSARESDAAIADAPDGGVDGGAEGTLQVYPRIHGSGCPLDTSRCTFDPDEGIFTVAFDAYAVQVEDLKHLDFADCFIIAQMASNTPKRFAIPELWVRGHAQLTQGVNMFATLGGDELFSPLVMQRRRIDLSGPRDEAFVLHDVVQSEELVWSPCGRTANATVATRIGVTKPTDEGTGLVDLRDVPHRGGEVSFRVVSRACTP